MTTPVLPINPPIKPAIQFGHDIITPLQTLWDHPGPSPVCLSFDFIAGTQSGYALGKARTLHIENDRPVFSSLSQLPEWINENLVRIAARKVLKTRPMPKIAEKVAPHGTNHLRAIFFPAVTWIIPRYYLSTADHVRNFIPTKPNAWLLSMFFSGTHESAHDRIATLARIKRFQPVWGPVQQHFNHIDASEEHQVTAPAKDQTFLLQEPAIA